jgi:hypothetical protein
MTSRSCSGVEPAYPAAAQGTRQDGSDCGGACRFLEGLVASAFGVPVAEVRSATRGSASAARARQTAMYLAHIQLALSYSAVGRLFGRDRTTVAHACIRTEDSRDDPQVDRVLACLEATFGQWRRSLLPSEATQ